MFSLKYHKVLYPLIIILTHQYIEAMDWSEFDREAAGYPNINEARGRESENEYQAKIPEKGFSDLVGLAPEIIDIADEIKIYDAAHEIYRAKPILLYGPSGTGKSSIAESIAYETGWAFYPISASRLITAYQGSGPKQIRELFKKASSSERGAIVFIDEIDAIANNKSSSDHNEVQSTLYAIHDELDKLKGNILCFVATNYLEKIPAPLLGRFSRIYIGLPNREQRFELFKKLLGNEDNGFTDKILNKLAGYTHEFNYREIHSCLTKKLPIASCFSKEELVEIEILKSQKNEIINLQSLKSIRLLFVYWAKKILKDIPTPNLNNFLNIPKIAALLVDMTPKQIRQSVLSLFNLSQSRKRNVGFYQGISPEDIITSIYYQNPDKILSWDTKKEIIRYFLDRYDLPSLTYDLKKDIGFNSEVHYIPENICPLCIESENRTRAHEPHVCEDMVLDSLSEDMNVQDIRAFIDSAVKISTENELYISNGNQTQFKKLNPYRMFSTNIARALLESLEKKATPFITIETLKENPSYRTPTNTNLNASVNLGSPSGLLSILTPLASFAIPAINISIPVRDSESKREEHLTFNMEKNRFDNRSDQVFQEGVISLGTEDSQKYARKELMNTPPLSLLLVFKVIEILLYDQNMDVKNSLLNIYNDGFYINILIKLLFIRNLGYFTIRDIYSEAIRIAKSHGQSILTKDYFFSALHKLHFNITYYEDHEQNPIPYYTSLIKEKGGMSAEQRQKNRYNEIKRILRNQISVIIYNENIVSITPIGIEEQLDKCFNNKASLQDKKPTSNNSWSCTIS